MKKSAGFNNKSDFTNRPWGRRAVGRTSPEVELCNFLPVNCLHCSTDAALQRSDPNYLAIVIYCNFKNQPAAFVGCIFGPGDLFPRPARQIQGRASTPAGSTVQRSCIHGTFLVSLVAWHVRIVSLTP